MLIRKSQGDYWGLGVVRFSAQVVRAVYVDGAGGGWQLSNTKDLLRSCRVATVLS